MYILQSGLKPCGDWAQRVFCGGETFLKIGCFLISNFVKFRYVQQVEIFDIF